MRFVASPVPPAGKPKLIYIGGVTGEIGLCCAWHSAVPLYHCCVCADSTFTLQHILGTP